MNTHFDVIVVGSGPAGVSASFPLVEAGFNVLLVDGGQEMIQSPPTMPYLSGRASDEKQWEWIIGRNYHALRHATDAWLKFRVPTFAHVFEGFQKDNHIAAHNFVAVGSSAQGGLSNAWGCGVSRLSDRELSDFPFPSSEMLPSYETVTCRMGVSGGIQDDLSDYIGLDPWIDPPIQMDALHSKILDHYTKSKPTFSAMGIRMGRSRVAALVKDREERKACNLSGNCFWGCHRRSLYSAVEDLNLLKGYHNFTYKSGFIVERVTDAGEHRAIEGRNASGNAMLTARKIIIAAGTLATTRIALRSLHSYNRTVTLQSSPMATFMLWLPTALGAPRTPTFGLSQISFALSVPKKISGFGSLLNTTGIPIAEFAKFLPLRKRYGIDLLKGLLSSCIAGNIFLPGSSTGTLSLTSDNTLNIEGHYHDDVHKSMSFARQHLQKIFWKLGAITLPNSFIIGRPGSDIHYTSTLPMRANPTMGETNAFGELFGLKSVYIADGASLPSLTEKSHTLTIMANADRIGRKLVHDLTNTLPKRNN